jgi:hypothetical protein
VANIEKLIGQAREYFEPGESPVASVYGAYETKIMGSDSVRNGIFIATNKRLLFYGKKLFGYDLEIFPYSNISSIEMGKNMMGHHISFFASGNKASMKWIKKGDVPGFVEQVKSQIGKKAQVISSSDSKTDIAEQITKLAELRDKGILSEEEFQSKKRDMLSRM